MTDLTNPLLIIITVLFVSAFIYWCLCKHTGMMILYATGIYMTIAGYLFIMSRYLFQNRRMLPVLLAATLLLVICTMLYGNYMLVIEDYMRVAGTLILLAVNLLGFLYAYLMAGWNILSQNFLFQVHTVFSISSGIFAGFLLENAFVHFGTRCFYLWEQCTKLLTGLLGCLILLYLRSLFINMPLVQQLLSFFLSLWIVGIYPVLIRRIQHYEYRNS